MWIWFVLAVVALILELVTGTFYLLLAAVAFAGAGIAAWLGAAIAWQLLICSVLGLAGLYALKAGGVLKKGSRANANRNTDVIMDIGQIVQVAEWSPARTASVQYRGAQWQARLDPSCQIDPAAGQYRITGVDGIVLILAPDASAH